VEPRAAACARCGVPLRLQEEPAPSSLDRPLDLDRRELPRDAEVRGAEADAPELAETAPGPWKRGVIPAGPPRPRTTPAFWGEPGPSQTLAAASAATPPATPLATPTANPGSTGAPQEPGEEGDFEILGPAAEEPREEPAAPTPPAIELHFTVASRGQRLVGWAVDGLLAGALAWLLVAGGARLAGGAEAAPVGAVAALAALLHFTHASLGSALAGRTLGKWMAGAEVVGPDGRFPSPGRAALRAALSLLSAALLVGLLVALVDRRGRALHDRLLRTAVVRPP